MFVKVTTSGGHRYARLVESFRNEDGQPRQRTVATLGRIDECGGQLDALLGGLLRAKGRPAGDGDAPQVRFESACQRRLNIDPPCRSKIDPGRVAEI